MDHFASHELSMFHGAFNNPVETWERLWIAGAYRAGLLLRPRAGGGQCCLVVDATAFYLHVVEFPCASDLPPDSPRPGRVSLVLSRESLREHVATTSLNQFDVYDYEIRVTFSGSDEPAFDLLPTSEPHTLLHYIGVNYAHRLTKEMLKSLMSEAGFEFRKSGSLLELVTAFLECALVEGEEKERMIALAVAKQGKTKKVKESEEETSSDSSGSDSGAEDRVPSLLKALAPRDVAFALGKHGPGKLKPGQESSSSSSSGDSEGEAKKRRRRTPRDKAPKAPAPKSPPRPPVPRSPPSMQSPKSSPRSRPKSKSSSSSSSSRSPPRDPSPLASPRPSRKRASPSPEAEEGKEEMLRKAALIVIPRCPPGDRSEAPAGCSFTCHAAKGNNAAYWRIQLPLPAGAGFEGRKWGALSATYPGLRSRDQAWEECHLFLRRAMAAGIV